MKSLNFLFLFLFLFLHSGLFAQINKDPVKLTLSLGKESIQAGENIIATVNMIIAEDYVAYSDKFEVKAITPQNLVIGNTVLEPEFEFFDKFSNKMKKGVKSKAVYRFPIEIPGEGLSPGKQKIVIEVGYQACSKKVCLWPQFKKLESIVTLKPQFALEAKANTDNFRFDQKLFGNMDSFLNTKGSLFVLFIIFLAGILTSFTPCIFPMIPITLAVIGSKQGQTKTKSQSFFNSLMYVLGIAVTYTLLGAIASMTGKAFGSFLGHPLVISGLVLIFILMALSMFGLFELKLPNFLTQKLLNKQFSTGYFGAFFYGLVAGIVASPCVGPVLVSILTYVTQKRDVLWGSLMLFVYAFGLGQIFLVLGTFTHLINKLPKSGPWLQISKYVFGVVMLVMAAFYAKPLFMSSQHDSQVKWEKYSENSFQKAIKNQQPIILDFYADWCAACKELDEKVFSSDEVQEFTKNFVWIQFDATKESDEFEQLRKKYQIVGLPTVLFFDPKGEWQKDKTLTGFEDKKEFLKRISDLVKEESL